MRILALIALLIALTGCTMTDNPVAILNTSHGDIEIELYEEKAPTTTQNFIEYVEQGHYDGLVFHRVIPGFMIQGGGFTPEGEQAPTREPIRLETQAGLSNQIGTVAMARTNDPDSATSQFFINTANNTFLDPGAQGPGYAVFGKVVKGMEAVEAIERVPTSTRAGHRDWPTEDVTIHSASIR